MDAAFIQRRTRDVAVAMSLSVAITCANPTAPPPASQHEDIASQPTGGAGGVRLRLSLTVAIEDDSIAVGDTTKATAIVRDPSGELLPRRSRQVSWRSSNAAVASVGSTGIVVGRSAGTASITGTLRDVTAQATITVTAPHLAPPPEPPSSTIVAQANFNDSTISAPLFNPYGTGLDFPYDPTGSGRGRVARFTYAPSSGSSMERAVAYEAPSNGVLKLRYGQTMWFKGKVFFPAGTGNWNGAHNRKVVDWQGIGGPRMTLHRVGTNREMRMSIVDCMNAGVVQEVMDPSTGILLPDNVWHTIEIRMTTNTADNVRDGIVEIYMNGAPTPTYRRDTGLGWITEKCAGGSYFFSYLVGFQLTINSGDPAYSEYRYWDDIVFSTSRVP